MANAARRLVAGEFNAAHFKLGGSVSKARYRVGERYVLECT